MYVAVARANLATINPDSQNYFITLYIAGWVIITIILLKDASVVANRLISGKLYNLTYPNKQAVVKIKSF